MWELVILHGLSQVGCLRHEQVLSNGRCPDVDWKIPKKGGDFLSVVADITTISDSGLEDQNPFGLLSQEAYRLASKVGMNPGSFWCEVRGKTVGPSHKSKMRLMLPEKAFFSAFVKDEIEPWFYELKKKSELKSIFECTRGSLDLRIIYNPAWLNGGGSYTSYKVATSKISNPLFNALKGKVKQLSGAPDDTLRLVIACDGGCDILRNGAQAKSHYTYSSREIAEDFLRQHRSVDFVLLVTIAEFRRGFGSSTDYQMKYELICAPSASRSRRVTVSSIHLIEEALRDALRDLPQPLRQAYHSAALLKRPGVGNDLLGGYAMRGREVAISSRGLMRLLSGQISIEEFQRAHGWNEPNSPNNPFAIHASSGLMISKIDVIEDEDSDDDKISFTIDKFDAANTPFISSSSNKQTES
ncbi:hypothetical protein F0A16_08820 [Salinicola corii]|uniref:Uncharacterized protein n=2 Tax=Salinicola corii TaxID=2606937 RepID=A0A640WFF0_9GAMM|nr:hypothetical protein F0A16_08820 [Salinicola corii]